MGVGEAEARQAHQRKADEDGSPSAETRRGSSSREPADQRACRVRGDERSDSRLGEVKGVGEAGEERRERRVQHRVHPDERGDEEQEAAHLSAA